MDKKKYSTEPIEQQSVGESDACYEVSSKKSVAKRPCSYSAEEIRERIRQGEKDVQDGLFCTQEEMRKRHQK